MASRTAFSRLLVIGSTLGFATMLACSSSGTKTIIIVPAEGTISSDGGATDCAKTTTFIACLQCCGTPPQAFFDAQNAFDACRCDTCKTECATSFCAATPTAATPACEACATSDATSEVCFPKADAICQRDTACTTYQSCTEDSSCNDKPDDEPDGG